jgi:hypothetical protein
LQSKIKHAKHAALIQYLTFGAIKGSKSDETWHNCGGAAQLHAGSLQRAARVFTISDLIDRDRGIRSAASFGSQYSPDSQRVRAASRTGQDCPFPLFSRVLPAVAGGNCAVTNFFAVATQSSQLNRILRPRHDFVEQAAIAASVIAADVNKSGTQGQFSHRITVCRRITTLA